jgi:OPA family sugar phosphate sensor protein UhpC-like MFS transporter
MNQEELSALTSRIQTLIEQERSKNPDIASLKPEHAPLFAQIISNYNLTKTDDPYPKAEMIYLGAPTGTGKDTLVRKIMHDNPESKGLKQVEVLTGEKTQEEVDAEAAAKAASKASADAEAKAIQKSVFKNPGVWFLALASGFMYVARYAVNGWGTMVLEGKGFETVDAAMIISINAWCGIFGTVLSGFLSDKLFKGDRQIPALVAGILHVISLIIFLYGGNSVAINVFAMVLRGLAIGVLICFLGGLMAVDIVPRKASGSALGVVGLVSYIFASTQDIISGILIDKGTTIVDGVKQIDFTQVGYLWIGAAVISFILPLFNWKKRQTAN